MTKQKTFANQIFSVLLVLTGLLVVILLVFIVSFYGITEKQLKDSSDSLAEIYVNELKSNIAKMNQSLMNLALQTDEFSNIKSSNGNERNLAYLWLHNYMTNAMLFEENADAYIVYEREYGFCLDTISHNVTFPEKLRLRDFVAGASNVADLRKSVWYTMQIGGDTYLCRLLDYNNNTLAVFSNASRLLTALLPENSSSYTAVLTDENGIIDYVWGGLSDAAAISGNIEALNIREYYLAKGRVDGNNINLYYVTSRANSLKQADLGLLALGLMVGVSLIYMLFMLRRTKMTILSPMQKIISDMDKIRGGEFNGRINGDFQTKEFAILKDTTNQMLEEIVELKIQAYEKQIALKDIELKSIRLQLKPHFFLNALTTISSLSRQNKNDQIQSFIIALSKNVRYMFRAGFHTVPIKDEILHVKNYFEMQELKYPNGVFHICDVSREIEEWQIPQMLIHTFIENEYKYAVSPDRTLTVLIKARKQLYNGIPMLLIEIEDDGNGYPQEVLDYMSGKTQAPSEKWTRVGLTGIKHMMELMYEREGLVQLSNIEPHGCLNRIYVPENAVHGQRVE